MLGRCTKGTRGNAVIESYGFGKMVIDGKPYNKDVIILPGGSILHPWWRKSGHRVEMADIDDLVKSEPDVLVIGTGNPGLMKPNPELRSAIKSLGIELVVTSTKDAVKRYNDLMATGKKVGACFHLTC